MSGDISRERAAYEIRVKGHLGSRAARLFEGFEATTGFHDDGTPVTILTGLTADQSALHGTLNKVRDLGMEIVSVSRVENRPDK